MSLANVSIRRPTFITSLIIVLVVAGYLLMSGLGVDQFPNVTFPVVTVTTPYPGAGPTEIETLVSKTLEDEVSGLSGLKTLRSINKEGISVLVSEFTLETDVKYAEQQIRDRVSAARRKLPTDIKDPIIRRLDPGDLPIATLSVEADLPEAQLYDLADQTIRPRLEQVPQIGLVEVLGGRKREVHVELDRALLKEHDLSASAVAERLQAAGQNIPAGKIDRNGGEVVFRTLGEFKSVTDVEKTIVNFLGNDVPVRVKDVGHVADALEDENSRVFINGKQTLALSIFKQSGANTIAVVDGLQKRLRALEGEIRDLPGHPRVKLVRNGTTAIHANVDDVKESIFIGILLTVIVVYFFLGSVRSTIITGLSLPTSLLGAFILMAACGFTVNIMTLLALSLAVGLLIDDAIVVRENIFRHQHELGKDRFAAALEGTKEVTLAVIATTLTVIAVFGPIAFLKGMVGQFFREFGLTICFAMLISLFDALTIAPMMSAYFAGKTPKPAGHGNGHGVKPASERRGVSEKVQGWIEDRYVSILGLSVRRPALVLITALGIFFASIFATKYVPKTFLPAQDMGEFAMSIDLPAGTSLAKTADVAMAIDTKLRAHPEVVNSLLTVGNRDLEANKADFYVTLVPKGKRTTNTTQFKELIRGELKRDFAFANPAVTDYDPFQSGMRPFAIDVIGDDDAVLQPYAKKLYEYLRNHPALTDVDTSYRPGKPEVQVRLDEERAKALGVSVPMVGMELRTQVEGTTPAVFREKGREYDIRVRLREDQRDLGTGFDRTFVPNINRTLVRLADLARPVRVQGPANITREDRGRYVQVMADVAANGPGLGGVLSDLERVTGSGELKPPAGVRLKPVGQAENFQEMQSNMAIAMGLGVLFIYLVLASLYESWVTPFTIMLVLPLAACGAFFGLLVTQKSLDIYSMIGMVLLLGIATKNSILLVDYVNMRVAEGVDRATAIIEAGRTRLRPILMTSFALIAGMLPVAIGLNEASAQRTSMGIAVIGGLISSTLLTLVVIPAAYAYIDRFRVWSRRVIARFMGQTEEETHADPAAPSERPTT